MTLVDREVLSIVKRTARASCSTCSAPSSSRSNRVRRHLEPSRRALQRRCQSQGTPTAHRAINFSLAHDDGQSAKNLAAADVILVGVSHSGKTPTSIYLAMQHGVKAANYPLIPEDFDRRELPPTLAPQGPSASD